LWPCVKRRRPLGFRGGGCGVRAARSKWSAGGGLTCRGDGARATLCGVFSPNAFSLCADVSFYLNSKVDLLNVPSPLEFSF